VSRKVGRLSSQLVPGSYVLHPDRPDWGVGQVQTVVGTRVTVNFENAGKQLINVAIVALIEIDPGVDGRA
jgi:transcription elongation factor GreA-like protein